MATLSQFLLRSPTKVQNCHHSLDQDRNYSTDDAFFSNQKDYDVCSAMYDVYAIKLLAIHGKMIIKQINVCIYT